jgi:hypothetical protein
MYYQKNKQPNFSGSDNEVASHKMPPMVKGFTFIIEENH